MAMIWSNLVAGSALMAMAAAGVTRSLRPRMSATMISLPSPFILRKGVVDMAGLAGFGVYMAEPARNCQWRHGRRALPLALSKRSREGCFPFEAGWPGLRPAMTAEGAVLVAPGMRGVGAARPGVP